ncbi:thioredoxin [Candidatus Saccharibacteria bacterium]|nr:thioredoxin [Candidatus Saccharibacteria bacterium]
MAVKLLDFWAPWCPPCKIMDPVLENLEKELKGKIEFVKHNVDEEMELTQKYAVMSIPTYVIEKDDKEVARTSGARSKEEFKSWIEKNL